MEAHRKSAFDIIMTTIITLICVTVAFFIIQDLVAPKEKGLETMMTDSGALGTVNVSVESASRGSVVSYTKLYGDIVTDTDPVTLYSDVSGKVTSVLVARGDRVEEGDVIAYVDQSRPGYSYQESPVTSTVSGEVLSLSASVGDTVTTSTSLAKVRTDEDLKLATEVPERYISALESGSTSSFTVAAYPGRTYEAVLSYVSPTVDTSTRMAGIELDIIGDEEGLMEGMFATIALETGRVDDVVTVPSSAVDTTDGSPHVMVVQDGIARSKAVETGLSDGKRTAILSGLDESETVIVSGAVDEGDELSVRRPVLMTMVYVLIAIIAVVYLMNIEIALYPETDMPMISVMTSCDGADSELVEQQVTRQLEDALASVENMDSMTSMSTSDSSIVLLEFDYGSDLDEAEDDIDAAITMVSRMLPDWVDSPQVLRMDSIDSSTVMTLSLSGPYDTSTLQQIAEDGIAPLLERVQGVAEADAFGGGGRKYEVQVHADRLQAYGLSFSDITSALSSSNIQASGGHVLEDGVNYQISVDERFTTLDEIADTPVKKVGDTVIGRRRHDRRGLPPPLVCRRTADRHDIHHGRIGCE